MSSPQTSTAPLRSVIAGNGACIGFILRRRRQAEAFTADEKSLGIFDSEPAALAAVIEAGANR